MSRSQDLQESSLELLLDTICNTFGGVLFISLLVVVLLNLSSTKKTTTPPSKPEQQQLEEVVAAHVSDLEELKRQRRLLESLTKDEESLVDPTALAEWRRLQAARKTMKSQLDEKSEHIEQIAKSTMQRNEVVNELDQLQKKIASTRATLQKTLAALEREEQLRTRTAELPKMKDTRKTSGTLFLKGGRLYVATLPGERGMILNDADCETKVVNNKRQGFPKAGGGQRLTRETANALAANLANTYDREQHFITIFVWKDSFEEFQWLKDQIVRRQFNYMVVPRGTDDGIDFGKGGGKAL